MSPTTPVRFCNNPVCDRCDEHLPAHRILRKAGREVCPDCLEPLVVRDGGAARPIRLARPPARGAEPGAG